MTLKITELSKKLDGRLLFKDVSLEAGRGKILGLFGASGVGKSLLMRLVAGLEVPDSGNVVFDSTDLTSRNYDERGFSYVQPSNELPQNSGVYSDGSGSSPGGISLARDFDAALEKAEGVLLLDNPFCFMDRKTRDTKIRELRRAVRERGLSVIFATNRFREIFLVSDAVSVLSGGTIVQTGTPRDVYEQPANSSVAEIAGQNNIFAARQIENGKSEMMEFETSEGGHRLFTDHTANDPNQQDIFLSIRPEHISISFGASFPEDNLLKAEIVEIAYQGPTTLIRLNANGLDLEALVLRLVGLNIGDQCVVGLPPDRIRVLTR